MSATDLVLRKWRIKSMTGQGIWATSSSIWPGLAHARICPLFLNIHSPLLPLVLEAPGFISAQSCLGKDHTSQAPWELDAACDYVMADGM